MPEKADIDFEIGLKLRTFPVGVSEKSNQPSTLGNWCKSQVRYQLLDVPSIGAPKTYNKFIMNTS